jgi:peptidoglycan/LPS O-acetylase OafA/YrhL
MASPLPPTPDRHGEKPLYYNRHFYSLDVLRGLAALSIVFYHWHHFFEVGTTLGPFDEGRQPLYFLLGPLYTEGWRAVSLFFSLSGFVFYWLYSLKVTEGKISAWEFAVLRFSRLYPLHFVTLLVVACEQFVLFRSFGSFFVFGNNDWYHFILQIFFISSWGFERGLSFNGPIWSVSVEVFLYTIFFITCLLRLNRWWLLGLFSSFTVVLAHLDLQWLSRGVLSFFIGGIIYHVFAYMWRHGLTRFHVLALSILTIFVWIVIPWNFNTYGLFEWYESCPWRVHLMLHHKDAIGAFILTLTQNSLEIFLFPLTILTFAVGEAFRGTLGKRLSFLGNISYSAYLVQFPLQLIFIFTVLSLSLPKTIFYSLWMMLVFFCLLTLISLASYHFLERPCQKLLRERLLRRDWSKAGKALASKPSS